MSKVKYDVWNCIVFLVHTASNDSADVMQGYLITHKISVLYQFLGNICCKNWPLSTITELAQITLIHVTPSGHKQSFCQVGTNVSPKEIYWPDTNFADKRTDRQTDR